MRRFIKGHVGLAATFWGFGAVGWVLCVFVLSRSLDFLVQLASLDNYTSVLASMGVLLGVYFLYTYSASIAIWRSASRYTGKRVWALLAKLFSVTLLLFLLVPGVYQVIPLSYNPATKEVVSNLRPTDNMPYIGFWKATGFGSHGIAIAPAQDGLYSVSFCGPGRCFEPGEWAPNTNLVNDPRYKIIDMDTIQILSDSEVTTYHRS